MVRRLPCWGALLSSCLCLCGIVAVSQSIGGLLVTETKSGDWAATISAARSPSSTHTSHCALTSTQQHKQLEHATERFAAPPTWLSPSTPTLVRSTSSHT